MTLLHFLGPNGQAVPISADNPLPVPSSGMAPEDISATAPATWDPATATIGVALGTTAGTAAAGNDARLNRVAAHVDPATGTVADVVNALIAAGLMASA